MRLMKSLVLAVALIAVCLPAFAMTGPAADSFAASMEPLNLIGFETPEWMSAELGLKACNNPIIDCSRFDSNYCRYKWDCPAMVCRVIWEAPGMSCSDIIP